jgi:hypothetical protein
VPDQEITFSNHARNTVEGYGDANPPFSLVSTLPEMAEELRAGLPAAGLERLLLQVDRLVVVGYCNCGDDFCSTILTDSGAKTTGPPWYGEDIECANDGIFIVHLDDNDDICELEVLYRSDYREALLQLFPGMRRE